MGVLLTNSQWPRASGFDAADRWPQSGKLMTAFFTWTRREIKMA